MKILHTVQAYYPVIGGSEELVRKISEGLALKGNDVTVFTSGQDTDSIDSHNGVKIRRYKLGGNSVRGIRGTEEEKRRYTQDVVEGNFDLMMNYAAQSWHLDLLLPILDKIKYKKVLAPVGYSGLFNPEYKQYFDALPDNLRKYDHLIYHSEIYQDKTFGDKNNLKNYTIIPNFADSSEFEKNETDFKSKYGIKSKYMFLNVSNHYKDKGHRFAIEAFNKANIPDSVFVIIGNPTKFFYPISDCYLQCKAAEIMSKGKLRVLKRVSREDTVAAFKSADLFLFGSKVECSPLVIFEAMASKTVWLSTDVGNVKELKGGLLVSSPQEMSREVKNLLSNKHRYNTIKDEGYNSFIANHDLKQIIKIYETLYLDLLKKQE